MQQIDMSNEKPMVSAYPPRPLAEPRSGRYAGCKSAASEVFGCIPHGAGAFSNEVEKVGGGGQWRDSILLFVCDSRPTY